MHTFDTTSWEVEAGVQSQPLLHNKYKAILNHYNHKTTTKSNIGQNSINLPYKSKPKLKFTDFSVLLLLHEIYFHLMILILVKDNHSLYIRKLIYDY